MGWGLAFMAAGAALNFVGGMQRAQAARRTGEYNAAIAEQNAQISLQEAAEEERRKRQFMTRQMGQLRANIGKSGLANEGSMNEVLQDSAAQAELEALTIRHKGDLQALSYRQQGSLARMEGESMGRGYEMGAAASLLDFGGKALG
jgi:hypothetical protein